MSDTDRYRSEPADLVETVRALEKRISALERVPRLSNAAINDGNLEINGGALVVRRDAADAQGVINVGSDVTVLGEPGMAVIMTRSQAVEGANRYSGGGPNDGELVGGQPAFTFTTVDGEAVLPDFRSETIAVTDKSGSIILADSTNARRGMSHPRLNLTWFTANLYQTTTSGTFTDFAGSEWYFYHPHLRIRVLTQNDGGAASEIRIFETDSGNSFALTSVPAGSAAFYDLIVPRSLLINGDGENGNNTRFSVQHRLSSGAGTVRTMIIEMLAIDLSWSNPF